MRVRQWVVGSLILGVMLVAGQGHAKERIIVTSDGEGDDRSSLIRLLMYSTDVEIEGLVYTNSQFHHRDVLPVSNHSRGNGWIEETIDRYAQTLPNLRKHASGWADPNALRATIRNGNLGAPGGGFGNVYDNGAVGEGWDTEGSSLIVSKLLDNDRRRVWLQAWGGLSTIAQALYRIRASYSADQLNYAISKARVYAVVEQEDATPYGAPTFGLTGRNSEWLQRNFPSLQVIQPIAQPWLFAYAGDGFGPGRRQGQAGGQFADATNPYADDYIYESAWYGSNVLGHGPLGSHYTSRDSEGDSLAFFHVLNNGLRAYENPSWGGWGGRMRPVGTQFWADAYDDGNRGKGFWRWVFDLQSDFAARMDWALYSDFGQANHPPAITAVAGGEQRQVAPGQTVNLGVTASDPDGNQLSYQWYHYREAGDKPYTNRVIDIAGSTSASARITIPADAIGKEIHVIAEVKDNGIGHSMKRYQRVILAVTGNAGPNPATPSPTPTPLPADPAPAPAEPDTDAPPATGQAGENMLNNAGFEDGRNQPWQAWGAFTSQRDSNARSGTWAARIGPGSGGGSNIASVKPGGQYEFSAWGKSAAGNTSIGYKFYDAAFNQIGNTVKADAFSANYEQRALSFTLPGNAAYAQLFAWNASSGQAYLDDVALVDTVGGTAQGEPSPAVPPAAAAATAPDSVESGALLNSTFENRSIAPWSAWGSFYTTNDGNARSGNWAVRVLPGNGGGTNVLSVQPGQRYLYSAWGKASSGSGATIGLKFFDSAYQQIGEQQKSSAFGATYSQRELDFQVPGNASYVQVFGWNASAGSLYLDDITLEQR